MANPWEFKEKEAATLCVESRDPIAYSPMQKVAATACLYNQHKLSDKAIAILANVSPSTVRHQLRLARNLCPTLHDWLHKRLLGFGHAKILAKYSHAEQVKIAKKCVENRWAITTLKKYLADNTTPGANGDAQKYFRQISEVFGEQLGFPVKVSVKGDGPAGKIEIQYYTLDDFDSLCERFGIKIDN